MGEDHLRFLHAERHHSFKVRNGGFVCVLFAASFLLQTKFAHNANLWFFFFTFSLLSGRLAYLLAFDLLVNEKIDLLLVSGGVVDAAGGWKPVSASSTRLLVVTGQGFSQVPMSYKSDNNTDINNS